MAISLRLSVCFVLLVLAEALETFEEGSKDCISDVLKATASCQTANSEQSAMANDVCGSTTYTTTMTTVTHLKEIAVQQTSVIEHSVEVLAKAKAEAATIAKEVGAERTVLLGKLADQKKSKAGVATLKEDEAHTKTEMESLSAQADRATEDAVEIARTTDDQAKVDAAKKKACDLRSKYLDLELKLATLHRSVHTAKQSLLKVSHTVEQEIGKAQTVGAKEATALKTIAKDKEALAAAQKKQAELEWEANQKATKAAMIQAKALKVREEKARKDVATAKANTDSLKRIVTKTEETVAKAKAEKPPVEKLDMKMIEVEAKKKSDVDLLSAKHTASEAQVESTKQSAKTAVRHAKKAAAKVAAAKATASSAAAAEARATSKAAASSASSRASSTSSSSSTTSSSSSKSSSSSSASASPAPKEGKTMEHRAHQTVARARGEPLHSKFNGEWKGSVIHGAGKLTGDKPKQGAATNGAPKRGATSNDHMLAGGQTSYDPKGAGFTVHTQHGHGFTIKHESTEAGSTVHVDIKAKGTKKNGAKKKRVVKVATTGASKDIHDRYADKVRAIEKKRLEAIDSHREAEQNLAKLTASHASPAKIAEAKSDVAASAQTMKNLVAAQTAAVAQVVKHIEEKEPLYTKSMRKTPTDRATTTDSEQKTKPKI